MQGHPHHPAPGRPFLVELIELVLQRLLVCSRVVSLKGKRDLRCKTEERLLSNPVPIGPAEWYRPYETGRRRGNRVTLVKCPSFP